MSIVGRERDQLHCKSLSPCKARDIAGPSAAFFSFNSISNLCWAAASNEAHFFSAMFLLCSMACTLKLHKGVWELSLCLSKREKGRKRNTKSYRLYKVWEIFLNYLIYCSSVYETAIQPAISLGKWFFPFSWHWQGHTSGTVLSSRTVKSRRTWRSSV